MADCVIVPIEKKTTLFDASRPDTTPARACL